MGVIDRQNAIDFANAGISICPIVCDGSKRAAVSWGEFQNRIANDREITEWYSRSGPIGTAVICGVVSEGLEILDFDTDAFRVFTKWREQTDKVSCRLPIVETPSGGYHVYYRCNTICGNEKIAMPADGRKPFIESRGEGGYAVTVTSPSEVHSENYPYVQVAGPVLPEVPTITSEERKFLWEVADTFDETGIRETAIQKFAKKKLDEIKGAKPGGGDKLTPWDDFNSRGDWESELMRHGWTTPNGRHWKHPNASQGHKVSASLLQAESGDMILHVFSTSTPLDGGKSHSLFNFVRLMDFDGDASNTTKELRKRGYGN